MQMLLDGGASKTTKDVDGRTPRDVVCLHEEADCSEEEKLMLQSLLFSDEPASESLVSPEAPASESLVSMEAPASESLVSMEAPASESLVSMEAPASESLVSMEAPASESLVSMEGLDQEFSTPSERSPHAGSSSKHRPAWKTVLIVCWILFWLSVTGVLISYFVRRMNKGPSHVPA